jgi:isocitrate/isopropylmalate dehydrogenase
MAAAAVKQSLKLGMIPADGIGKEVLPVSLAPES